MMARCTGFTIESEQPFKVIKAALLGAKGNADSGQVTIARLPNQALTTLGKILSFRLLSEIHRAAAQTALRILNLISALRSLSR